MATKRAGGLPWDRKKNAYVRSLGWLKREGHFSQPKFYLGRDQAEAERRNLRLEQLWQSVVEMWEEIDSI